MKVGRQFFTNKTPVPGFKGVIGVAFGIGEGKTIFIGVLLHPDIRFSRVKAIETPVYTFRGKVDSCA